MFKLRTLSVAIAALVLTACGSSDDDKVTVVEPEVTTPDVTTPEEPAVGPITYGFKSTGEGEPEYLVTQEAVVAESLSAEGNGIEQQGWNFFYPVGNTLFVTGYENKETTSYSVQDGEVKELARFTFNNTLEMFGQIDGKTLLATDNNRSGGHSKHTMYVVSAESGHITQQVNYSIFNLDTGTPGEGLVAWATALVVRDGELFVPFHKMDDGGNFMTPDADKAYVAIFDYPLTDGATPKAIIEDERTSNIGVNGSTTSMIKTQTGDLYTMSNGTMAGGFYPASTKPSGILKIESGASEFDPNYFFNVETTANGGKLIWFDYIGDNKAIARVIVGEDGLNEPWSAFGVKYANQKLVIIDLEAQTITDIVGVPLHRKRYSSPVEIMDGKVYVSIETSTVADDVVDVNEGAYVYEIDIASASAVKGGEIKGKTIKGFYDLFH